MNVKERVLVEIWRGSDRQSRVSTVLVAITCIPSDRSGR